MLTSDQLEWAAEQAARTGRSLSYTVAKLELVGATALNALLAGYYQVDSIDLGTYSLNEHIVKLVPRHFAVSRRLIAVQHLLERGSIVLAMADPSDAEAKRTVHELTGLEVEARVASEVAIEDAILATYGLVN